MFSFFEVHHTLLSMVNMSCKNYQNYFFNIAKICNFDKYICLSNPLFTSSLFKNRKKSIYSLYKVMCFTVIFQTNMSCVLTILIPCCPLLLSPPSSCW